MHHIDLSGTWTLRDAQGEHSLPATVPGCVHTDLLTAGKILDPWFADNEKDMQWVALRDWIYERTFSVDPALLAHRHLLLRFEGLDTLCQVELNGQTVLDADNMHRTWEVDVRAVLREGDNQLRLLFFSPLPVMKAKTAILRLPEWNMYHEDFHGKSYVRKMACAFGWDWGLMAPTAGIWRPASLLAFDARIEDLRVTQVHQCGSVDLLADVAHNGTGPLRATLSLRGQVLLEQYANDGSFSLSVPDPELWWPNGMGGQERYTLTVELLAADGAVLDTRTLRLGLRSLELFRQPDAHGESFRFRVNGRDVFMKGGNWIPCDVFPSRVSDQTYRHLLQSCADAHMNMLRVWGGGIYEDERFYDLCDELGILVWQDFMFACATYPTFDPAFMANVRAEAVDNIRRLRHRPCMALWCGNNELEQGMVDWTGDQWTKSSMPAKDYRPLFDELLADLVEELDGQTPYWPSSPHTPGFNRKEHWDHRIGDAHAWSVWFGGLPIEGQRDWNYRFMSEFGFQSYPELKTVVTFTAPEDRKLINWVMDYHQRSNDGNQKIYRYLLDWFQEPRDFESALWMTQMVQALCIQYAGEHARRIQGRMDGLLYWQINDLWPGATWSSIDVYGRWKALQYFARRFFAPVLVSLLEDGHTGTVQVHVSNHRAQPFTGQVRWQTTNAAGTILTEGCLPAQVASQTNAVLGTLDCQSLREAGGTEKLPLEIRGPHPIPMTGDRDLFVWAVLEEEGVEVSRNLAFFAKPKYWKLADPKVQARARQENGAVVLDLEAAAVSPWTRLELREADARFSDNFLHLTPSLPAQVTVFADGLSADEVLRQLRITPLRDNAS